MKAQQQIQKLERDLYNLKLQFIICVVLFLVVLIFAVYFCSIRFSELESEIIEGDSDNFGWIINNRQALHNIENEIVFRINSNSCLLEKNSNVYWDIPIVHSECKEDGFWNINNNGTLVIINKTK